MGEAKRRGTKEERTLEGARKLEERLRQNEINRQERWNRMTPTQREKLIAIAGISAAFQGYSRGIINNGRMR